MSGLVEFMSTLERQIVSDHQHERTISLRQAYAVHQDLQADDECCDNEGKRDDCPASSPLAELDPFAPANDSFSCRKWRIGLQYLQVLSPRP